ncbi:TniQ family protein [Bradyrhizobium sp. 2]|uniref:TniQ family protein n=1 Tax=Bradyrhizobium sp. 2 TaxID=190045 RepID=UPI001FF7C5D9|nr:TniQ family protein [Bradyrhizobium sp. 2]MCK1463577.1 TniQ family protein [Bradyrhizobium sp. 2]
MKRDVGIYRSTVDGTEVTSFLDPPAPAPDESLLGWVTRAAEDHAFRSVSRALIKAGFRGHARPESLPMYGRAISKQLSFLLKAPTAEIEARVYEPVRQASSLDQIAFFGSQIRRAYRETTVRRISPRALSVSPHHRAIWEIRIFGFCTDTRELLLASCPVCGKTLGWQRTHGIEYCDSCKNDAGERLTDLRDFPQPKVTAKDEAGLEVMCDLIHPLSERKARARKSISPAFADYANGEIFEFGVALCCAETMQLNRTQKILERPKHVEDYARFTPEVLSHAGRAILDWPNGLHAIADRIRAKAGERAGFYGIAKELGPLTALGRESIISHGLRGLVREAINRDMRETASALPTIRRSDYRNRDDLITCSQAIQKYRCRGPLLRNLAKEGILRSLRAQGAKTGPLLFYDAEISDLFAKAGKAENQTEAAVRLGIPAGALPNLAMHGMITRVVGPETRLLFAGSQECYVRESIDLLISSIEAAATPEPPPETCVRITKAVNRIGIPGPKPWCEIFTAILDRKLKIWRIDGRLTAAMTRHAVEHIDRIYELIEPGRFQRFRPQRGRINYREAADLIGTSESMVARLVRAKEIPVANHFQLKIERADAIRFNEEKVLTSELSKRTGIICKLVRPYMADLGVEPIARTDNCGGFVWSRSQVEAVLAGFKSP